jgi:hypothetical protein
MDINATLYGGAESKLQQINNSATILNGIFTIDVKKALLRAVKQTPVKSLLGKDVISNSIFAVQASCTFVQYSIELINELVDTRVLFNELLQIDKSKVFPLVSKLKLDRGFNQFRQDFTVILDTHTRAHGRDLYMNSHQQIARLVDLMTTMLADWFACLLPDTPIPGIKRDILMNSEISKNVLNHVANHGYDYIYHLVALMTDKLQQLITNPYALVELITLCVDEMIHLLQTAPAADFIEVATLIQAKVKDKLNITQPREFLIMIIQKYIKPNINFGVNLFYQMLPVYLMFVLFIQNNRSVMGAPNSSAPPTYANQMPNSSSPPTYANQMPNSSGPPTYAQYPPNSTSPPTYANQMPNSSGPPTYAQYPMPGSTSPPTYAQYPMPANIGPQMYAPSQMPLAYPQYSTPANISPQMYAPSQMPSYSGYPVQYQQPTYLAPTSYPMPLQPSTTYYIPIPR